MKTSFIVAAVATFVGVNAASSVVTCSSGCPSSSADVIVTRSPVPTVSCTAKPLTVVSGSATGTGVMPKPTNGTGTGSSTPTYTPIPANNAGKLGSGLAGVAVAVGAALLL